MLDVRGERIIFAIPVSMGMFYFLFLFFSVFSVFSLYTFLLYSLLSLINFSFRWDFVLVRVKQVVRFYKVFIIKSGGGELMQWGRQLRKRMNKIQVDKLSSQHHPAGQIQVTRCFNGY